MDVTEKIDKYLNEKSEIPSGLLQWVEDYKDARKGNIKLAKEIKANIDKEIKKLKLNKKEVYGDLN
jgi:hypothetical protein